MASEERAPENMFLDLTPTAKRVLHQIMMSGNNKLAKETAQDVLDRAGQTRKADTRQAQQIVITNSQVAILAKVADEVEERLENDQLFDPNSKELKDVTEE